jgi:hypothetical protein
MQKKYVDEPMKDPAARYCKDDSEMEGFPCLEVRYD